MIYDSVKYFSGYAFHSCFDLCFSHFLTLDPEIPQGRIDIIDGIYANIDEYHTKNAEFLRPESHRKYLDIQILLRGTEQIHWTNIHNLTPESRYEESRDLIFYKRGYENFTPFNMEPGLFMIFFPQDAHMACITLDKVSYVKKIVYKIPLDLLNNNKSV